MTRASIKPGYSAAWYDMEKGDICLKYWDGNQDAEIERHKSSWSLFLGIDDYEDVNCRELDALVDRAELCDDDKHVRVYAPARTREQRDKLVKWFRKRGIEPMEGDVDPLTRWMSDNPIRFAEPRILFYDLETDSRKGFLQTKDGKSIPNPTSRILSAAWAGTDGAVDVEVSDGERDEHEGKVLETFFDVVAGYDLLVAWNGDAFDDQVLRGRAKRLGFHPAWSAINFLDLMLLFKHPYFGFGKDSEAVGVKTSYSLENIARTVLGHGKLQGVSGAKVYELWRKDKGKLAEYNAQDVRLMQELEKVKRYIAGFTVMAHTCNRFVSSKAIHAGYANDGFMLMYGAKNGIRLPTKKDVDESIEREQLEGAVVFEPKPGLHEGVCAVDFSALYPSLIRTFNVSPETRVDEKYKGKVAVAANGARFRIDVDGVVPQVVAQCTANRAKYKAEAKRLANAGQENSEEYRQAKTASDSWKVVQNSLYGLFGSPYSRIFDPECSEAVTKSGQYVIKSVAEWAEASGLPVLYADTDSNYLRATEQRAREFMGACAVKTDAWVESVGGKPGYIRLDLDAQYKRIFWTVKKRYAGLKTTGKVDIKGLELVRTDGCRYRREFQREVIYYILFAEKPEYQEAERLVRQWAVKLYAGKVAAEDLAITVGLSKMPSEYAKDLPQARVAREMMRKGREVFSGMKIPYVVVGVVKTEKGERTQLVHVEDYAGVYDAEHYWREQTYPGVHRVLEAVFPVERDRWKRLEKFDPSDCQVGMFAENSCARVERLVLRLGGDDLGKLEALRELACEEYDGLAGVAVPLWLETDGAVVETKVEIKWARPFVREVEKLMGHRVYYGADNELGGK